MAIKKEKKPKELDEKNNNEIKKIELCKNIQSNIYHLSQNELYEIFKILYTNKSTYTKNNNGVFVNLNWLNYIILEQVNNYIIFCIKSHKEIKKHEIMKNMYNENLNKKKKINIENNNEIDISHNIDNIIIDEKNNINNKMKISSSMKFYLFKKKFLKKQIIINNNNNNNILYHENYLLKNDL